MRFEGNRQRLMKVLLYVEIVTGRLQEKDNDKNGFHSNLTQTFSVTKGSRKKK